MRPQMRALPVLSIALAACGSSTVSDPDLAAPNLGDLSQPDKAARCVSDMYGAALTNSFGRLDGTVVAVVKPSDQQCDGVNNDHVVLEVLANGGVYRMVVNVLSNSAVPQVFETELQHALPGAAWSEGWHPTETLDYVSSLGVHKAAFVPYDLGPLSARISDRLTLDSKISVYATSSGGDSAHLVHRNKPNQDGAIVIDALGPSPIWLLFAFDNSPTF